MVDHRYISRLLAVILTVFSVTALPRAALAAPLQAGQSLEIAWLIWLVVISVFLLVAFIVFVSLDWGDASRRGDEDE